MTGARSGRGAPVSAWAAWSLLVLCVAMLITALGADALGPRPFPQVEEFSSSAAPVAVAAAGFMTVGALPVVRVPGNRLGWILCACALLMALNALACQYAIAGLPWWHVAACVSCVGVGAADRGRDALRADRCGAACRRPWLWLPERRR